MATTTDVERERQRVFDLLREPAPRRLSSPSANQHDGRRRASQPECTHERRAGTEPAPRSIEDYNNVPCDDDADEYDSPYHQLHFPTDPVNPWATYRRAPPVGSRLEHTGQEHAIHPYATYRRAPKVLSKYDTNFNEQLNRIYERNQATVPGSPPVLPLRKNVNNKVSDNATTIGDREHAARPVPAPRHKHKGTNAASGSWATNSSSEIYTKDNTVKHLFPVKLNDLKATNSRSKLNNGKVIDETETSQSGLFSSVNASVTSLSCCCIGRDHVDNTVNSTDTIVAEHISNDNHLETATCPHRPPDLGSRVPDTPFFYCRIVATYPKAAFLLSLSGHLLVLVLTVSLLLANVDLFPTDFETLPMYDWNVPWRKRDLAWRFREQDKDRYVRKLYLHNIPKWYRSMAYGRANVVLYYDAGKGNVFTTDHLKRIADIENNITSLPDYQKYCVQSKSLKCVKPTSILRLFDGTFAAINPVFHDPNFNNIKKIIYAAKSNNRTKGEFAYFLSKDHSVNPTHASAHITRTIFPIGYPLDIQQKRTEMEDEMVHFLVESVKPLLEKIRDGTSDLGITYWSYLLFKHDIVVQVTHDLMFALGSVLFIFCFMVYHTKSLWISSMAVMSIMTSFLTANMIYRLVLDFRYFGYFHVITIFIILGIGADDLFVFLDVWKNSAFTSYPSLAHRLHDAYRRSALSMLFTSLTTAVAFFASAFSPLLALYSFGIFAGILVIVNYISVIIFFPTVVTIYHIYFQDWHWPGWKCLMRVYNTCSRHVSKRESKAEIIDGEQNMSRRDSLFDEQTVGSSGNVYLVVGKDNPAFDGENDIKYGFLPFGKRHTIHSTEDNDSGSHMNRTTSFSEFGNIADNEVRRSSEPCRQLPPTGDQVPHFVFDSMTDWETKPGILRNRDIASTSTNDESPNRRNESMTDDFKTTTGVDMRKKKKVLVRFFRDYYFHFVSHRIVRWVLVVVFSVTALGFAYSASKIQANSEQVQFYRRSHNYGRALELDFHSFVANKFDRNVVVYIVWGLRERDIVDSCHFSDSRCFGRQRYDSTFNPHTPEAQMAIKGFCDTILNFSPQEVADFHISRDIVTGQPEIKCFMENLQSFFWNESKETGVDWMLPWDYKKTLAFMQARGHLYDTARFNKSFTDYLEIPISYWLNDGYRFTNKTNFNTFQTLIGEKIGPFSTPLKTDFSVFYGNKIRYLGIQVNLTLGTFTTGYSTGRHVLNRWESFVQNQMKRMPPGLQNGFQLTKDTWHTISIQKTMADNAITGIVAGILLAFPILTLATQNIIVGFCATLSMCCSTICVVGIIPLVGWKLDILVSLNMCMVVGLSVDYVVHLAEGYHMSRHTDRASRVQNMLEEMGISVFSGACTTLGASVFMLFAQVVFLLRFGIFMLCTIGFSLLYSFGFFTTLMVILGPSGDTGDICVIFHRLTHNRFKQRSQAKASDNTDQACM